MNCKQFNSIKLEEILMNLGHLPTKQTEKEAWFLNPFANETEASFKVDIRKNQWFLFSEFIGGNNVDFIKKYFKCSISEVLSWAKEQNFSSFHKQIPVKKELSYKITEVTSLQNWNLKKYLISRGLSQKVYAYLHEVKFTMNTKKYYAIGFKNNSDGWELRNSFYKGGLLKKDISLISNNGKRICVFEGFMDALSYIELNEILEDDILVLNSIALLDKAKIVLQNYDEINLYFDHDRAGEKATRGLIYSFPNAKDCSGIYQEYKDLNEFLLAERSNNIRG